MRPHLHQVDTALISSTCTTLLLLLHSCTGQTVCLPGIGCFGIIADCMQHLYLTGRQQQTKSELCTLAMIELNKILFMLSSGLRDCHRAVTHADIIDHNLHSSAVWKLNYVQVVVTNSSFSQQHTCTCKPLYNGVCSLSRQDWCNLLY